MPENGRRDLIRRLKFKWAAVGEGCANVSGTDSGLGAVQIGTALLVKVSVFRYVVWTAYSFKCLTAWTVKVEAIICSEIW